MNLIQSPSPNFNGRSGHKPELIVLHCTEGNWDSDKEWLRNPASIVSSHFVISPSGEVHQLVSTENAAWHAGRVDAPTAKLKKNMLGKYVNPNLYSVGIEVSLRPPLIMPEVQKEALKELITMVATQYGIAIDRDHIVGHREIYSLKTCPGTINVDAIVKELQGEGPGETNESIKKQIIDLVNKLK